MACFSRICLTTRDDYKLLLTQAKREGENKQSLTKSIINKTPVLLQNYCILLLYNEDSCSTMLNWGLAAIGKIQFSYHLLKDCIDSLSLYFNFQA